MVNGDLVNGQWWMVKTRTFYSFWIKMQTRTAHYQFSVINYQLSIPSASEKYQSPIIANCPFTIDPSPPQPARAPPNPVSGCKPWRRLDAYGNKGVNEGLVNGQWSMVKIWLFCCRCWSYWPTTEVSSASIHCWIILFQRFACWSKDQHGL
jgi:hypothetical protein